MTISTDAWLTVIALFASGACLAEKPLGQAPTYTVRQLSDIPNAEAVTRRIWVPGIDDGYVPQGLTFLDGALFVSSYRSTESAQNKGPCRLYKVDAVSGATLGWLDLPASCGHAGGVAKGRAGHIIVADTAVIFEITLSGVSAPDIGRVVRSVQLTGLSKGSFAAGSADGLWLGTYSRDAGAKIYKFSWDALDKPVMSEVDATAAVPLPTLAQGAAFDQAGRLWVMRSNSKLGELVRLDLVSGTVQERFAMPIGSEDISFEPSGALWGLSEAGSRRWNAWPVYYPVIFRLDVSRLK